MKCSSSFLIPAAFLIPATALATPAGGQTFALTAGVRMVTASPAYHVRLDWQKATPGPGGLTIRGSITNTGTMPLTYTQVTPMLVDHAGIEVFRGSGYLTASPLLPGQSAEFRACETAAPRFAALRMVFREAGQPVLVDRTRVTAGDKGPEATAKAF